MKLTLDLRFVTFLLLVIIGVMLALWKPWQGAGGKTITVSGEATVSAVPDEFIFSPNYQKKAATSNEAISQVSKLGNEIVAKLKELGITDDKIKTSVTSNPSYEPLTGKQSSEYAALYSVIATVNDKELAKKVLDYIATTPTLYGVSPQSTFSKETRKKLESEARGKGLADARTKANQTAQELGVKLGKISKVTEGGGFGGPITIFDRKVAMPEIANQSTTPPILQTGNEDVNFTVNVEYQIR
jgi:uncharacterized protein